MPLWMKKLLVILITIFTLGHVQPPAFLTSDDVSKETPDTDKNDHKNDSPPSIIAYAPLEKENAISDWSLLIESIPLEDRKKAFVDFTVQQALVQATEKFGPKITARIGDSFQTDILPSVQEAIYNLVDQLDPAAYPYLAITTDPTSGYGEKIFHIYDERTNEDLFRFHVRREHPPLEGHWFTFHYHTISDNHVGHYPLGKIYWDKNTPPKWKMYS